MRLNETVLKVSSLLATHDEAKRGQRGLTVASRWLTHTSERSAKLDHPGLISSLTTRSE